MHINLFRKIILSYRDYYGFYHRQKEKMAWVAFALYAGFSVTMMQVEVGGGSRQEDAFGPALFLLFLLFSWVTWSFIKIQFKYKQFAARIVEACSELIFEKCESKEVDVTLSFHEVFPAFKMPAAIFKKMRDIEEAGGKYKDKRSYEYGSADKLMISAVRLIFLVSLIYFINTLGVFNAMLRCLVPIVCGN